LSINSKALKTTNYRKALGSNTELSSIFIENMTLFLHQYLSFDPIPDSLLKGKGYGRQVGSSVTKLQLNIARGHPSWEGLVVGFPGTKEQLATAHVGTPLIREILYPILELHNRVQDHYKRRMPCIYFIGERFSDVLLRKFRLIGLVTPHVIVFTHDILSCLKRKKAIPGISGDVINENWVKNYLLDKMCSDSGLTVKTSDSSVQLGFLSHEVPTFEGTKNPERLDILGYDKNDNSLVAFEIKGPQCSRIQLENLYLQGIEHRNWLEENKMALKLLFEGPRGNTINTRKRVKLLLGFFGESVPSLFYKLREQALRKDRFLSIDFCRFVLSAGDKERILFADFDQG